MANEHAVHVRGPKRILVVLNTLAAEGTPTLALQMCKLWRNWGLDPHVLVLFTGADDLLPDFTAAAIPVLRAEVAAKRYVRYGMMAGATYRATRHVAASSVLAMTFGWHTFLAYGARAAGARRFAAHVGNYPPHWDAGNFGKLKLLVHAGQPVTTWLICCSEWVRSGVIDHIGVRNNVAVIHNGCPVDEIAERAGRARSRRDPAHPFNIGMVARVDETKDHATLIDAAAILAQRGRRFTVTIVGDGRLRTEVERRVRERRLDSVVTLLGMRRDVPELLGCMDAFAFSTQPGEGLGIALIEAMAASVPCVATDAPGCREVLGKGQHGTLVPAGDASALAEALDAHITSEMPRTARTAAAYRFAGERFSLDAMARRYAEKL